MHLKAILDFFFYFLSVEDMRFADCGHAICSGCADTYKTAQPMKCPFRCNNGTKMNFNLWLETPPREVPQ